LRASAERTKWLANARFIFDSFPNFEGIGEERVMTELARRINASHAFGDYAGGAARATLALSTLATVVSETVETLARWRERATQRRRLMELDTRLLSDIGLSRADALSEAEKPFWQA
jgi:uncharacterized protein YjiS (DUF1127 family)